MTEYKDRLRRLDEFRNYDKPEIKLSEVEKFMFEFGVERVLTGKGKGKKKGKGSIVTYRHPLLRNYGRENFTIHKTKSKVEKIRKFDFRNYLYKPLCAIIELMKKNGA